MIPIAAPSVVSKRTPYEFSMAPTRPGDHKAIMQIEETSFAQAWEFRDFKKFLTQQDNICLTCFCDKKVVGYICYVMHKDSFTIINMAVHPLWRRKFVAGYMVSQIKAKLAKYGRKTLKTTVRETNLPAQLFFHDLQFLATKVMRKHYDDEYDTGEDAYAFEYKLLETNDEQAIVAKNNHSIK